MAGKKTGKRLLTWVLVLVMALSLLPLNALAEDVWSAKYDWIRIYLDDATKNDLEALNGTYKKVCIVSTEYLDGMRPCAPLSDYWWTENARKVTASDIESIDLAKVKAVGGGSSKISIPIHGNETYKVKVSEGYHEGLTEHDSYSYLRIDISKLTPEPPAPDEVTVTIKGNTDAKTYDGTEKTVTGYTFESSNPLYKDTDFTFNGTAEAKGTDVGNYEMGLKDSDFENTNTNFSNVKFVVTDGTLTINKRSVTLTSASDSKVYDGTPLTKPEVTVTGDGFVDGEVTDIRATGSVTNVSEGAVTNTIEYTTTDNFKADNYTITEELGKLTINPNETEVTVTITGNKDTAIYDGTEKSVTGYDVVISNDLYKESDFKFNGNAEATGTDAGTYQMNLKAADFENNNNNFKTVKFVVTDGSLTINKRDITFTSGSAEKPYDGTSLTNNSVTITKGSFADGEGATYEAVGSIIDVGYTYNQIKVTLNSNTKADNYNIYKDEGTLTITEASAPTPVTINLSDYIKKDLKVIGSGFQGETFTVTVKEFAEEGEGYLTGSVTYAANEKDEKNFTGWTVGESAGSSNYVFNNDGTITFNKENRNAYSFTVDEVTTTGTDGMEYDDTGYRLDVKVAKENDKLVVKEVKPVTLNNCYNGTFPVELGQYIKKVYKSECGCAPKTTFRFEALIKESVPEVNALSLIESVPVEKESKVYTAKGSVTLKAGTAQTVDMSIDLPEGIYEVTLKEVNDKTANVKYDKTVYTFRISVLERGGNVEIGFSDVKKDGKEYNEQGFVFTNSYVHSHFIPVSPKPSKPTLNTGDHYAYVMGYPDGTVRPNGSITRAEVSTILFRLLSDKTRDEYFTTESSFTDVKAGAWYNNSIATLEKAGVIVDTAKGGAFRPNEAITRAELAAMLAQFSDAKPVKGVKFSDVSAEHWAYEAIAIAAKMGWIEGYPDGTFRPDATITRAEMMTLVNRALERVPSDEDHLLSKRVMLTFPDCKSGDWFYIAVQEATNSHTYERAATEKNGDEQWTALRANRDWTLLEK